MTHIEAGPMLARSSAAFAGQWCGFLLGDAVFVHDSVGECVLEVRGAAVRWLLALQIEAGQSVSSILRESLPK